MQTPGAVQLWIGKKLCSSNLFKFTQKKISDQAHPLHRGNDTSRSAVFGSSQAQSRVCLSNEAETRLSDGSEISVAMRYSSFLDTKSWRFLIIIREVINFQRFVKLEDFEQN